MAAVAAVAVVAVVVAVVVVVVVVDVVVAIVGSTASPESHTQVQVGVTITGDCTGDRKEARATAIAIQALWNMNRLREHSLPSPLPPPILLVFGRAEKSLGRGSALPTPSLQSSASRMEGSSQRAAMPGESLELRSWQEFKWTGSR